MPDYKYNEDKYIADIQKYLDGTYSEHYVAKDIQVVDIWESLDSLETTARDTAIKYLCRYGKKGGKNRKDLLKAIHYIILMMYSVDKASAEHNYIPSEKALDEILKKQSGIILKSTPQGTLNVSEETYTIRGRVGTLHTHKTLNDAYEEVERYDTHSGKQ
jgi:hypothetical protein